jgi:hypothetical protein
LGNDFVHFRKNVALRQDEQNLVWKNTLLSQIMKFAKTTQIAARSFGFHIYIFVQIFENLETSTKIGEIFFSLFVNIN